MTDKKPPDAELSWEIGIPLLTNPRMLKTFALVTALAMAVVVLLLAVVLGSQGDWNDIAPIAGVFALVGVGLYVLFLLVMGLAADPRAVLHAGELRRGRGAGAGPKRHERLTR